MFLFLGSLGIANICDIIKILIMLIIISFKRLKKKIEKTMHFLSIFPNIKKLLISGEEMLMPAESKENIT